MQQKHGVYRIAYCSILALAVFYGGMKKEDAQLRLLLDRIHSKAEKIK